MASKPFMRGFMKNKRFTIAIYTLLSTFLHVSYATNSLTTRMGRDTTVDINLSPQNKLLSNDRKRLETRVLRHLDESTVDDDEFSICINETYAILNSDALLELELELVNIDSDYCSSDIDDAFSYPWKTCDYTELVDTYNEVCANEAGGKTLVFDEFVSWVDGETSFDINYFSRPFCASKSCTPVMIMKYLEDIYKTWEEVESYSIYFEKDFSLVCANHVDYLVQQYPELYDVYNDICGIYYNDDYYASSTEGSRNLNTITDHIHLFKTTRGKGGHNGEENKNRDEGEEGDDIYYGDSFQCEVTEDKVDEHKSICESEDIGGEQFLANIVLTDNSFTVTYIDYPFCVVDTDCYDTEILSSQLTEFFEASNYDGSNDNTVTVNVTESTGPDDDDTDDAHDSFHIKSKFPSAHHEWCIQPKDDYSGETLDPRTDIVIRQCDDESIIQEWTSDNYGRISPSSVPYLCITKVAFNRLELDYCGSNEDMDSMFIHNLFEDTISWKKESHMVFTISDYSVDENDSVLLAERDRSLHGQGWKIKY